jgi:putative ATPase
MGRPRDDLSGSLFGEEERAKEEPGQIPVGAPQPDTARADRVHDRVQPLADRVRPRTLDEILGQEEVLGPGRPLRRAIEQDQLRSLILWGPPGSGKTTLAGG